MPKERTSEGLLFHEFQNKELDQLMNLRIDQIKLGGISMPYKSDAQRRKFHAMEAKGEISKKVVAEYDKASKGMDLPERVKKAKKSMAKNTKKRSI